MSTHTLRSIESQMGRAMGRSVVMATISGSHFTPRLRIGSRLDCEEDPLVWLENGCYRGSQARFGDVARTSTDRCRGHGSRAPEYVLLDCSFEISLIA